MDWMLDKSRPICPQLSERICVMIASGEFKPRDRLMSVRDVAMDAGVNPNTVQKSFEQLESKGVIFSRRGSGWFVSDDTDIAAAIAGALVRSKTAAYLNDMRSLGLSGEQVITAIKEVLSDE